MLDVHSVKWMVFDPNYNCFGFYVFIFHLIQTTINYCMPKCSATEIAEYPKLNHSENNHNSPFRITLV